VANAWPPEFASPSCDQPKTQLETLQIPTFELNKRREPESERGAMNDPEWVRILSLSRFGAG